MQRHVARVRGLVSSRVEQHVRRATEELEQRVVALESDVREARLRVDTLQESMFLAEASVRVAKEPFLLLVEALDDYGNLAALARALPNAVGMDKFAVLARDEASALRWRASGIEARAWTTVPDVSAAPVWNLALSASVSVYEHHDWWRTPDRLVLRGLLAGSQKVQMWHGSAGPFGKHVGLLSAGGARGMYEFADVVTTSVGFRYLVCEPALAAKRRHEFHFMESVPDIDFRMRAPLASARADGPIRVLVAPTYPEDDESAQRLADRLAAYRSAALSADADVYVRHHAWTPSWVAQAAEGLTLIPQEVDLYSVLGDFDVLVTDFSSLAADMLLMGRRVVLDLSDKAYYVTKRTLETDEVMLALCDTTQDPESAMRVAATPEVDDRRDARARHAAARLSAVGSPPGENTLNCLESLLQEVPAARP